MKKEITIHAGHNKQGKIACGASDYIDESKEARIMKKKVAKYLRANGYKVYDCTVNNGTSQNDVLRRIVNKCNSKNRVIDVSFHFNAFVHSEPDGKTKGCEVLVHKNGANGLSYNIGKKICKNLEKLGFTNRGVKTTDKLYFLNKTKARALLVEICFVDDADDAKLYKKKKNEVAKAIARGIMEYI